MRERLRVGRVGKGMGHSGRYKGMHLTALCGRGYTPYGAGCMSVYCVCAACLRVCVSECGPVVVHT